MEDLGTLKVLAWLGTVAHLETQMEADMQLGGELMALVFAIAYLNEQPPRHVAERAFKALPTDETWITIEQSLGKIIDEIGTNA